MRNKFLLTALIGLFFTGAIAQESSQPTFNKWFIEGGIGVNKPYYEYAPGYSTSTPTFFTGELGVRYMLNELFGLKLGFDYNSFSEDDGPEFDTKQYGASLEGVINAGRLMKFETWTKTFNLLAHGGAGVSRLDYDLNGVDDDWVGNILGGLTVQAKLSPRVSLYVDGTAKANYRQGYTWDGAVAGPGKNPILFKGTIGLSIALGKNSSSADWYLREGSVFDALDSRVSALESGLSSNDTKDGQLSNRVDDLGRKVNDLDRKVNAIPTDRGGASADEVIAKLINDGYVNIYFDLGSSKPQGGSISAINTLKAYLAANSGVNVQLNGYADERGTEEFNQKLSQKRADAVAKLLTDAGIDASRITAEGKGEDISVDSTSATAYQLARRVSFSVK